MKKIIVFLIGLLSLSAMAQSQSSYSRCFVTSQRTEFIRNHYEEINPFYTNRMSIYGVYKNPENNKNESEIIFSRLISYSRNRSGSAQLHRNQEQEIFQVLEEFKRNGTCKKIKK